MSRAQPYLMVAGGVGVAIVFVALAIYYGTAAAGAPHLKHVALFVVLAVLSVIVSWFSYPKRT
jgi:hypothetical protein